MAFQILQLWCIRSWEIWNFYPCHEYWLHHLQSCIFGSVFSLLLNKNLLRIKVAFAIHPPWIFFILFFFGNFFGLEITPKTWYVNSFWENKKSLGVIFLHTNLPNLPPGNKWKIWFNKALIREPNGFHKSCSYGRLFLGGTLGGVGWGKSDFLAVSRSLPPSCDVYLQRLASLSAGRREKRKSEAGTWGGEKGVKVWVVMIEQIMSQTQKSEFFKWRAVMTVWGSLSCCCWRQIIYTPVCNT